MKTVSPYLKRITAGYANHDMEGIWVRYLPLF